MSLFDGLESLGFGGMKEAEIFQPAQKEAEKKVKEKPPINPLDFLFEKEFECPVCEKKFINFIVRKSKLRLVNLDTDLKPNYEPVDPNRYDVLLCGNCGYTALQSYFNRIQEKQIEYILQKIKPNYKPKSYKIPLSLEDAVERYKLALLNAVTKGVKSGEKAIICLKTAWLYRDMEDAQNEKLFLQNAFTGLKEAYASESFPIGSMDENTTAFMIGELARRVGEYSEAMRWISALVVKRDLPKGIKDRAINTKDMIRADMKE